MNWFSGALALVVIATAATAQAPRRAELKKGVRVAIVGDSITEQRLYSRFMADYLTACHPDLDARIAQFGWSGERASGFLARMDNDLMPFKPDVVTLCYGMNDGSYQPFTDAIGQGYEKPLVEIVKKLKAAGVQVIVGSPGAVDDHFFGKEGDGKAVTARSKMYNPTLAKLRDIAKKTADAAEMPFANVHDAMLDAMRKAQADDKLGKGYHVCGGDGFHPDANGQLVMAFAFLRAMKLDGDLGAVAIDFQGAATAAGGHKVMKSEGGKVSVESARLPFGFTGDAKQTFGTRSIAPFLPFNTELNRFTLTVKNAPAGKMKVTWGAESRTFAKDELEKGVNLAAEFQNHPLLAPFLKVDAAIANQQNFQTFMIKQVITNHRFLAGLAKEDPEIGAATAKIRDRLWAKDDANHATVRATLPKSPVAHTIVVEKAE
jgi:lysophospholipase L1-like esterase